jgi:hypothetical protein
MENEIRKHEKAKLPQPHLPHNAVTFSAFLELVWLMQCVQSKKSRSQLATSAFFTTTRRPSKPKSHDIFDDDLSSCHNPLKRKAS